MATGTWKDTYDTKDGESHPIDMFYTLEVDDKNELWVMPLIDWMAPSLYIYLQNTYVRMNLTCTDSSMLNSCVLFRPT